ncbi:hypothetical protein [Pseudomonas turukhanskensis]|uniref:DUF680 domain-containing protein n=1 Tax=Pseudomonas turukhanskensis TaxID=1806536 RepID=A0A9W6K3K3_9PSED|nr:hypothetical protein [Pseudomonas turukhanskensis]GLK88127.1 hypothetical protein GCM10017655_11890 [Pseudomonas turukhanskensis]
MKTIVTASLLTALLTGNAFAAADVNHSYEAATAKQTAEQSKTVKADDTTQAVDKKDQSEDDRWGLPRWWH